MENLDKAYIDVQEWIKQGQVLTGQGMFAEAESYFNRAISSDSMNYAAYMSRGIMWASSDQLDKAKEDFSKAVKVNREIPDAYYHLGNIAFMQDDLENGAKYFNTAIAKGYDDAELYFHFGLVYEEHQEYELAVRYYTKAIHKEQMNVEFRIRKATTQMKMEQWEESLETLDALFLIAPDSFEYYHLKSLVLVSLGRLDEADQLLKDANESFPGDLDVLTDRIAVLVAKGDYDCAFAYIQQIRAQVEDPVTLQKLMLTEGKLHAAQEKMEQAIVCLNSAAEIDGIPVHATEALYLLCNIHQVEENYDEMYKVAQKLLVFKNVNAYALSAWYYIAFAKKARGDKDYEAYYRRIIKEYRTVVLDDPARIDAYLYRAMAHRDIKEYDKALEMIEYILIMQPENADLHAIKSMIYKDMGREKEMQEEAVLAMNRKSMLRRK